MCMCRGERCDNLCLMLMLTDEWKWIMGTIFFSLLAHYFPHWHYQQIKLTSKKLIFKKKNWEKTWWISRSYELRGMSQRCQWWLVGIISLILLWILFLKADYHKDDLVNVYSHFRNCWIVLLWLIFMKRLQLFNLYLQLKILSQLSPECSSRSSGHNSWAGYKISARRGENSKTDES